MLLNRCNTKPNYFSDDPCTLMIPVRVWLQSTSVLDWSYCCFSFHLMWWPYFSSAAGMCCDHDLVITHSVSRVLVAVRLKVWQQKLLFLPQIISLTWRAVRRRIPVRTGISTAAHCSVSRLAATYPLRPLLTSVTFSFPVGNAVVKSDWGWEGLAHGMFALPSSAGAVNSRRGTHILGRKSGIRWWKWADNHCLPHTWQSFVLTALRLFYGEQFWFSSSTEMIKVLCLNISEGFPAEKRHYFSGRLRSLLFQHGLIIQLVNHSLLS